MAGLFDVGLLEESYVPDVDFSLESENWSFEPTMLDTPDSWSDVFSNAYEGVDMSDIASADAASGSWWDFDQSKISSSIQDVLSGAGAGLKAGIQSAVQSAPQTAKGFFDNWLQKSVASFQNTATGKQIEAAAIQEKIRQVVTNPLVMLAGGAIVLFLVMSYFGKRK
jgi:hypothetical protein